ncbi:MAG: hypothetical protein WCS37_03145 [Chloroflexota bacterium]|nr:hypothetical protein [Chloroflexota bacterium]
MKKVSFASLMLGFGGTLAVLVAVAMPPGGWGVAVGVGLGLLGCIPVFVIAIMVVNRDRSRRYERESYEEAAPPQIPVIVVQQPGLPYGNHYAQFQPETYNYFEVPEGYEYYPQEYLAPPPPRQKRHQVSRRPSLVEPRLQPAGYYPSPNATNYTGDRYYNQPENYYGQAGQAVDPRGYYDNDYLQLDPYQRAEARRSVSHQQLDRYEEEDGCGYAAVEPATRERQPGKAKARRSNISKTRHDEPVDAEFRTIGE